MFPCPALPWQTAQRWENRAFAEAIMSGFAVNPAIVWSVMGPSFSSCLVWRSYIASISRSYCCGMLSPWPRW